MNRVTDRRRGERSTWLKIEAGKPIRATRLVVIADDFSARRAVRSPPPSGEAHERAWAQLWEGRIEGAPLRAVQQLVNACVYHLYSQARSGAPLAVGPCGISGDGYLGGFSGMRTYGSFRPWLYSSRILAKGMVEYRYGNPRRGQGKRPGRTATRARASRGNPPPPAKNGCPFRRSTSSATLIPTWHLGTVVLCVPVGRRGIPSARKPSPSFSNRPRYWAKPGGAQCGSGPPTNCTGSIAPMSMRGFATTNACTNYGAAWTLRNAAELAGRFGVDAPVDRFREIAGQDVHSLGWKSTV